MNFPSNQLSLAFQGWREIHPHPYNPEMWGWLLNAVLLALLITAGVGVFLLMKKITSVLVRRVLPYHSINIIAILVVPILAFIVALAAAYFSACFLVLSLALFGLHRLIPIEVYEVILILIWSLVSIAIATCVRSDRCQHKS